MLKLRYLYENFEQAKECLKLYDCDETSLDDMLTHFRISSNAIYPFREKAHGQVCFLRLSPVQEKSYEEVESEIHLIMWLIGQGYPAMKPFPMKYGRLSTQLNTACGTLNVSCFEGVPGKTLEDSEGNLEIAYGYGKALGLLHRHLTQYPLASERIDHNQLLAVVHKRLVAYHAPVFVLAEYDKVCRELSSLTINNDTYGMVHYDFEPDNVLFDAETHSFGVIDFDDAIPCWFALDIVRAMDAMDDVVDEPLLKPAMDKFMEGYQSEKSLSDEQRLSLPLMRRLVNLQSYATILHVMSEDIQDPPDWILEINGKLTRKLHSFEDIIQ